ncbi:hypothetical protein QBC32DRAFT_321698 [Pseudoneurospora amorphoporcata]|uniref:Uncharacterized protein n=1 Tax=Pseudoneurospora amorphoporcata TaxID=241081 RepID=A0AAN6SJ02_9PEZI|nr:hypothetical protein QBC32DRAFT_321698 [Pseudoneurospora amorphoporcata]
MADSLPSTPPPRVPDRRDEVHHVRDVEYESTQPLSLFSQGEQRELGDDILDTKDSEANISTASFTTDDEQHCRIDLDARTGFVAWKDDNQEEHHTSELRIDLYMDTAERQALFALHGYPLLKGSNKKTNLILFIYPEMIQSIGLARTRPPIPTVQEAYDHGSIALHFTMSRPPSLVAPRGSPLEAKNRYQGILNDMKSLGTVRQFTVYLNILNLELEAREQLVLLPSVFSSAHPFGLIRTDEKRASLDTLFHSAPGQVIDLGQAAVPAGASLGQTLAEMAEETAAEPTGVIPPPYPKNGSSENAPGYPAPVGRKRRTSESVSPVATIIIRTTESRGPDESVQPPSVTGSHPQSPNEFSTPTHRKRRCTSELLSRSPSDEHILLAIRRVLDRTANLDNRVKQVEKLITECLNIDSTCRYDTEEAEHIIGHMNDRIDDQMYDVRRELEGALLTQTEEWVAETVESVHEELRKEIEDEWVRDILQDMTVKVEKMVKSEVLKDVAQAVKVVKNARAYKEDGVKPTTTTTTRKRRMSSTTASSTQSTATSTTKQPPFSAPSSRSSPPSLLSGAKELHAAMQDIQKRYSAKISTEEMMRVLDFLSDANSYTAVKYLACSSELRWLYVQRWAKVKVKED